MQDIRYKWMEGVHSVGIAKEVQLPQFRVLGHNQRTSEVSLSTGSPGSLLGLSHACLHSLLHLSFPEPSRAEPSGTLLLSRALPQSKCGKGSLEQEVVWFPG